MVQTVVVVPALQLVALLVALQLEGEDGSDSNRQQSAATQHQMKLIKPLLSSASRLGKALAELFGLLVKVKYYHLSSVWVSCI